MSSADAYKEYYELLELPEEKEASYSWFDFRDRGFMECRTRVCERIQALERKYVKPPSETSNHSRKSKRSGWSMTSSSSSKRLSLALIDAAAKAAKAQAEMEFLEKEKELRRLQLEKDLAIANAEESAIKRIIEEERPPGDKHDKRDKEEVRSIKRELEPDLKAENVKQERSFSVNPYAHPFVPSRFSAFPSEPLRPEPVIAPQYQSHDVNKALHEIVSLQAKQTELSSLIINQQKLSHLPVKEPPVFSGEPFEYPAFVTAFDSIISSNVPSDRDRFYFLDKYTKGKANDVVKGFVAMSSDSTYKGARKLLDHRFGNPVHVAEAYKSSLRKWPQIHDGDSSGIQEFSDFLVRCEEAMKTVQSMGDLDSTETLKQISSKLPSYCGVKWCRHAHETQKQKKKIVTFSDFVKFVREEAELANDPIFSPDVLKRERKNTETGNHWRLRRSKRPSNKDESGPNASAFATLGNRNRSAPRPTSSPPSLKPSGNQSDQLCPLCNGQHDLAKCSKFLKSSVEERSETIRTKGLCYGCFKKGHMSASCPARFTCGECGGRHHTLLHRMKHRPESRNPQSDSKSPANQQASSNKDAPSKNPVAGFASSNAISQAHNAVADPVHIVTNCGIVEVVLFHKDNPEKEMKVYALLDDASDTTFVTTQVQQELGIEGVKTSLDLSTMLGREKLMVERVDGLVARRLDGRTQVELPKAYARQSIPCRRDQIPTPEIADKWPHFEKIRDKIPPYEENVEVALLIGYNCPKAIKSREVIHGKSDEPYAVRTLLRWSIVGPVATSDAPLEENALNSSCNRIIAKEIIPGNRDSQLSFVLNGKTKEIINPSAINEMFELDFVEHKNTRKHGLSKQGRKFLEIAEQGIHQCEDGQYELPLPLKNDRIEFPNNRDAALRRLNQLKRRFEARNGQKYREDYIEFMKKMIDNGYAEKVPQTSESTGDQPETSRRKNVWYIPHHGVYHPKKPNKIRVVFDCAAEYENESLNKHMLQGPDLTNNLTGVLCCVRIRCLYVRYRGHVPPSES